MRIFKMKRVYKKPDKETHECDQCEEVKEIAPFFDPIYGREKYWICDECNERNYDRSLEGDY